MVTGDYKLSVTGVAAADVAKTLTTKNIYSVEVKDTAANILKNLTSIQTAVTATKIQNVVITDATNPSLSINDIFTLTTTLPNVTFGAGIKFNIKDTASNIIAHARADIGDVLKNSGTVAITDKTTPNLTLADAITLKGIINLDKTTKYNVTDGGNAIANQASVTNDAILSGATKVTTAQIFSVAQYTALSNSKSFDQKTTYIIQDTSQNIIKQSNITGDKILSGASSVIIQDTAGSVTANLAALQTLANSQKLTNINLIDSGTPALNLTATQISSSALLLGKITSSFNAGNGVGFQPGNSVTSLTPWSAPATVNIAPNSFNFRTYERPINNGSILANVTMDAGQLAVDGPRSAALYLTPQDGLGNSGVPVKVADMKTTLPNGYGPPNGGIFTINFASSGNGTSASKNMQAIVWMDLQSDGTYSLKGRTYTVSTTGIANDPNSASVTFNGDAQTLVSGISSKLANFNWTNINVANNTNMCFEYETLDATDPTKKNAYEASFAISSDYKTFNQLSTIAPTSGANAGALLIAPLIDAKTTTGEISNGNNGQATFVYETTQNGQTGLVFNDLSSQNGIVQNTRFLPLGNASDNIKLNAINNIPLTDPSGTSTYWMNQMIGVTGTSTDSVTGDKSNFVKFIKLNSWLPSNSSDPNMTPLAVTTINLPNKPGGMWNCNTNYNTSMWAFQEGSSAHVVQVDGNGKIISDDKITLPPGATLDRIRNSNSTNTSMFELLWREPDPANAGANIIKYQLYDIRNNAPQYVIDNTNNSLSYLAGASGNDTMQGRGSGVNVFSGGAGNDTIIAGTSGQDIASYTGKSTDYSIKLDPNDATKIIVSDLRAGSPDGTDTLIGINKLRFADKVITASSLKNPNTLQFNNYLNFSGLSSYVSGSDNNLPVGNSPRTIEVTAKFNPGQPDSGIFEYGADANNQCFGLQMDTNGKLVFHGYNNDLIGKNSYNDGNWHRISMVFDGNSISLYVDGVMDSSSTNPNAGTQTNFSSLNTPSNTQLLLGRNVHGDLGYQGSFNSLAVWNSALSPSAIANEPNVLTGKEQGLVSYYSFNSAQFASGTTTQKQITNLVDGTTKLTLNGFN